MYMFQINTLQLCYAASICFQGNVIVSEDLGNVLNYY